MWSDKERNKGKELLFPQFPFAPSAPGNHIPQGFILGGLCFSLYLCSLAPLTQPLFEDYINISISTPLQTSSYHTFTSTLMSSNKTGKKLSQSFAPESALPHTAFFILGNVIVTHPGSQARDLHIFLDSPLFLVFMSGQLVNMVAFSS